MPKILSLADELQGVVVQIKSLEDQFSLTYNEDEKHEIRKKLKMLWLFVDKVLDEYNRCMKVQPETVPEGT